MPESLWEKDIPRESYKHRQRAMGIGFDLRKEKFGRSALFPLLEPHHDRTQLEYSLLLRRRAKRMFRASTSNDAQGSLLLQNVFSLFAIDFFEMFSGRFIIQDVAQA